MKNKYPYIGKSEVTGGVALLTFQCCGYFIECKDANRIGSFSKKLHETYFANITADYLRNTKIRIVSPGHSEFVQKLVFGVDGGWFSGDAWVKNINSKYIFINQDLMMSHSSGSDTFNNDMGKEIKLPMPPEQASDEWPKVGDEVMCFNYEENKYLKVKVLDAKTKSDEFAVASITDKGLYGTLWWGCNFKQLPTPQEKLTNEIYNQIGSKDDSYALAKAILAGEIEGLVYKGG